jgi:aspartate kinase
MKVFKFGGASIKDVEGIKNVSNIISQYKNESIVIVVSALGKTTNAIEGIVDSYFKQDGNTQQLFEDLKNIHFDITHNLFPDERHIIFELLNNTFIEIEWVIEDKPNEAYDYIYDQLVSIGEMVSTRIVAEYLKACSLKVEWIDARELIKTDNNYREGKVDWELTNKCINSRIDFNTSNNIKLTQGFIGCTSENFTTTLGREGSDYSAAILAYCLDAESVTIWKDVAGVLNADPRHFSNANLIKELSYHEAIEMTYYGATVIHPKTLKPLQNKNIPLHVRSFIDYKTTGTTVSDRQSNKLPAIWVLKQSQALLSIAAKDFSFIAEDNMSEIFSLIAECDVKSNLMQNSALSFSICVDYRADKVEKLINLLQNNYKVRCNYDLNLLTVRHYSEKEIEKHLNSKEILLEQKSRNTIQVVYKN